MALAATLIWEVQTGGNDNNGGGFKPGATGTDFSQQATAQYALTGIATAGAGAVFLTASAAADMVGNIARVVSGTNFTVGSYEVISVSVGVSVTVDRNLTTGVGASGVINIGGCLASPGMAAGVKVAGNGVWSKAGTYTIATTSSNVSTGIVNDTTADGATGFWAGYQTTRGDMGTAPVFQVASSGVTSVTVFTRSAGGSVLMNMTIDGQSKTSIRGWSVGTGGSVSISLTGKNCTNAGIVGGGGTYWERCVTTGCSVGSTAWFTGGDHVACESYGNSVPGFYGNGVSTFTDCISSGNTGASSDGWDSQNQQTYLKNCDSYGNGRSGFRQTNTTMMVCDNCIAEGNTGYGFDASASPGTAFLRTCAGYNNTSGNYRSAAFPTDRVTGFVTGSASFFTNPGSGDFSLNTTAGGGAAARAAGYPGAFPRGTTTGYRDLGAAQHADPAAGGGYSRGRVVNTGSV